MLMLNSVVLPEDHKLERGLRKPLDDAALARYKAGELGTYDQRTLLYDVFLNLQSRRVIAIGPPLLGLQSLLPIRLEVAGHVLSLVQSVDYKKLVVFSALLPDALGASAGELSAILVLADGSRFPINLCCSEPLSGSVLTTLQKNNDVRWIVDWARYYRSVWDVDHILVYDNGSDNQDELRIALDGLATVIDWPFPYGIAWGSGNQFCQVGQLNHALLRFAPDNQLFNFDIDELLVPNDASIRSQVKTCRALRFDNYMVPHPSGLREDYSFKDITQRDAAPRGKAFKYVVNTGGVKVLNVHNFKSKGVFGWSMWPESLRYGRVAKPSMAYFLHYRSITTNWKAHYEDRLQPERAEGDATVEDQSVAKDFEKIERS